MFARGRLKAAMQRIGASDTELRAAEESLSPYVLTLAFARRFATYKRGNLLLRDPDRLMRLLSDPDRPLQIVFAGKAHPHDIPGKELIRELVHFSRKEEVRGRLVFLEDYDMTIAHYMTAGSDVWLNTPRRPLEASGTSGMKAGMNGVLNCSVMDGWWAEGYNPGIGWKVGSGEEYRDEELQDKIESEALYDLLEREIVPMFYRRGRDNLPREWITRMRASMRETGIQFSSHRMLEEYHTRYYKPALASAVALRDSGYKPARELSDYLDRVGKAWHAVRVDSVETDAAPVIERGTLVEVRAMVDLAGLSPSEVLVECFYGSIDAKGGILSPRRLEMAPGAASGSLQSFSVRANGSHSGQVGYSVRILPRHPALAGRFVPGLLRWA